jgi:glyoxylase-like metal-dependent hydrolase (beta-lactamase superfamily II)
MKSWNTTNGFKITRILFGRSNVFLVSYKNCNILIDTSSGMNWKKLDRRLHDLNIKTIDYLILTHSHYDHAANAAKLQREYGAIVIIHKDEACFLEKGKNAMTKGAIFFTKLLLVNKLTPVFLDKRFFEPSKPDIITDTNFSLKDSGINGYIIHTPGHTIGSQSIIIDDEIALVGDTMFGVFPGSVFPPFAEDEAEMVKSWGKLLQTKCRIFLPSHGTSNSRKLVERDFKKRQ